MYGRSRIRKGTGSRLSRAWVALVIGALVGVGIAGPVSARVPEGERVPVTDPETLQSMGFPADAQNVYMHESLLNPEVASAAAMEAETSEFGGAPAHFDTLSAKEFDGRESAAAGDWLWDGGEVDCCVNLSRLGTEVFADAVFDLPSGALTQALRFWANDTNAGSDLGVFVFEVCTPSFGPGESEFTTIASGGTTGSGGYQSSVAGGNGITINNRDCTYLARVAFNAVAGLTLQKLRFQWGRQVSPAPVTATFDDVPTSHPFFQFVEALVGEGITSGCGSGDYCPDQTVTRGQMAVFLARGLGLTFP